jgi:predicted enzyme related to lactoylglutathione lyase
VLANIAVTDVTGAKGFYEGKLGLNPTSNDTDGGTTYACADGTALHVYHSPAGAGVSTATQVGWITDDIDASVDELAANGVEVEQYDTEQLKTDSKGIAAMGDGRAAWFKDPDGNVLGLLMY